MARRKGRLVFIPEDSTWYEEIDGLEGMGELYCLDDLEDLIMLEDELEIDGDDAEEESEDADDRSEEERERDLEQFKMLRMIAENDSAIALAESDGDEDECKDRLTLQRELRRIYRDIESRESARYKSSDK